ncbi:CRISPR-associated protein Cas4 [Candidatus Woesearchaeota archaeon]|nr:CRISPR-associated protein Cas4 [Candidatus Woesearchaeota archaeon]
MEKISVTYLSSYLYCPRKLYLEKVLKIVKIPPEAIVKGNVTHHSFEEINDAEQKLVTSINENENYGDVEERYRKKYSELLKKSILKNKTKLQEVKITLPDMFKRVWPAILYEATLRAENVFSFSKKTGLFGIKLWKALTPKIESEVRIESDTLKLKGIIDEIKVYENEIVPVELKTGKAPQTGVWPGHKVQVGAYILLLSEKEDKEIKEGVVRYLDHKTERIVVMDPFLKKEVIELTDKVIKILGSKQIPETCQNKSKCNACQLYDDCMQKR